MIIGMDVELPGQTVQNDCFIRIETLIKPKLVLFPLLPAVFNTVSHFYFFLFLFHFVSRSDLGFGGVDFGS